jgi:signal transduction histidine kinase
LQEVVEGLLVLARLDAGREVPPAVRAAGDLVRDAAQHEGVDASLDGVGDERVVVHPELAAIALRNLVRNAARHGGSTRVVFRTRRVGDLVRIEVEDRGPGVPPEAREQVFDTLARGARARADDPEGLGLGLPLARRIARSEGGDCVLEAGAQGGTCAVLLLPSA